MDQELLRERFRGAMLGAAVGDALGAPFEGSLGPSPRSLERLREDPGPMQYTDDTHMTIGMAESLVRNRRFEGADMAATFARNFEAEPWRGYGAGPPQIFAMLRRGIPWDEAAHCLFGGTGSFGNGGAMRTAPAALVSVHDLNKVIEIAGQAARITHAHPLGVEGGILQAAGVALLAQSREDFNATAFLTRLQGYVRHEEYGARLQRMPSLLPDATADAVVQQIGHGIAAHEAVPAAIFSFLRHPDSFADTLLFAISLGGDTDTIASMAGALAGARLGAAAIPTIWRERVEGGDYLVSLADGLLDVAEEGLQ